MGRIGVDVTRQFYLDLIDGELHKPQAVVLIARAVCGLVVQYNIDRLVTFGPEGFDGHPDHKAMFQAGLLAKITLQTVRPIELLTLNARHCGERRATGNPLQKLAAMAVHASQFAMQKPTFWQDFPPNYGPLLAAETYDMVRLV